MLQSFARSPVRSARARLLVSLVRLGAPHPAVVALVLSTACVGPAPSPAASPHATSPALAVAETERSFARMASDSGVRDAFLHYLADDGELLLAAGVVRRPALLAAPRQGGVLRWAPAFVEASSDGSLAISTGPSESAPASGAPLAHGQFFTVWRRLEDGRYRVACDIGISHAAPPSGAQTVASTVTTYGTLAANATHRRRPPAGERAERARSAEGPERQRIAFLAADSAYAANAAESWARAAQRDYAPDARLLRDGRRPLHGTDARDSLRRWSAALLSRVRTFDLAGSWDLGVVRGSYSLTTRPRADADGSAAIAERGDVLRVWRLDGRTWRLLAEVLVPRSS